MDLSRRVYEKADIYCFINMTQASAIKWSLFEKSILSTHLTLLLSLSFNSIYYSYKNSCTKQKGLTLRGILYWNEFTIDKYQKCIDSKCVLLRKYVNVVTVKYYTVLKWNMCGGVYLWDIYFLYSLISFN